MSFKKIINYLSSIQWLVLILGFCFGLSYLVLTPPFQSPDEINHFYRAYQISDGHLYAEKVNQRVGGFVPESLVKTADMFSGMRGNPHKKTNRNQINSAFNITLNAEKTVFVDYPNTAVYSLISYAPQSISIFLFKSFSFSPLALLYLGRLSSLIFWLLVLLVAIRIMPLHKELLALLALLPMSLFINSSLNADVVSNALGFLSIAVIFRAIYRTEKTSIYEWIIIAFLAVCLASAKLLYVPVFALLVFVPSHRFKSRLIRWGALASIATLALVTISFWSGYINGLYIPYVDYNHMFRDGIDLISCANLNDQKTFIQDNAFYFLEVISTSLEHGFEMYSNGFIGTFGWLDTYLPSWSIWIGWIAIFVVSIFGNTDQKKINPALRVSLLLVFSFVLFLVLLSQHLIWDCVGGDSIHNLQGRYFIPIAPVLLITFSLPNLRLGKYAFKIISITALLLNLTALKTIVSRYYQPDSFSSKTYNTGAENVRDNLYLCDNGNTLKGGQFRSEETSLNGNYSAEMSPEHPFAFSVDLDDVRPGDIVKVNVWRNTNHGGIIISTENSRVYRAQFNPTGEEKNGWQKIEAVYPIDQLLRNNTLNICCWNPEPTTTFMDDFSIEHQKLNR